MKNLLIWTWIGAALATDALSDGERDDQDDLIIELLDLDAARGVELSCPGGHRDAARFVFGRAVLRASEDSCTLRFLGTHRPIEYGPAGPGELTCALDGGVASCFSTCSTDEPATR